MRQRDVGRLLLISVGDQDSLCYIKGLGVFDVGGKAVARSVGVVLWLDISTVILLPR